MSDFISPDEQSKRDAMTALRALPAGAVVTVVQTDGHSLTGPIVRFEPGMVVVRSGGVERMIADQYIARFVVHDVGQHDAVDSPGATATGPADAPAMNPSDASASRGRAHRKPRVKFQFVRNVGSGGGALGCLSFFGLLALVATRISSMPGAGYGGLFLLVTVIIALVASTSAKYTNDGAPTSKARFARGYLLGFVILLVLLGGCLLIVTGTR